MSRSTCQNRHMSLRHALLGLLADRPASGYELTKRFEQSPGNVWTARHSQIYPELQKMADQGLVRPGEEGPRGRREYEITDAGREELHRWLTSPLPQPSLRDEVALRVFFLWALPREQAAEYLDALGARHRENLAALDEVDRSVAWDASGSDLMARIALERGRRWYSAMSEWSQWAAAEIRAGHDAPTLEGLRGGPRTTRGGR